MGAFRIFSRFAELLDIKVTRAAAAWLRLNADGTVSERTAAQTLSDIGAVGYQEIKSADFTAVAGGRYICTASLTLTLPTSPASNVTVEFIVQSGTTTLPTGSSYTVSPIPVILRHLGSNLWAVISNGTVNLTTGVTGTLPKGNGGTGNTNGTADALTTARTIGGSSFDGTGNVTSFPSPGAIGGTTPSTGAFTALSATGTTTLTGQASITSASFPPLDMRRTTAGTNVGLASSRLTAVSSLDVTDGFGPLFSFALSDTGVSNSELGTVGYLRAGADNTGDFVVRPCAAGTQNERLRISSAGVVTIPGTLTVTGAATLGALTLSPAASATPASNGQLAFEATSNTSLTVKYKGSDGTVRSVVLTLT
jgi:hypothetical protein